MDMGFQYCQAIGELMFAAVTCHPDILFATIYLSQHSNAPARCHYTAVKRVFYYLRSTISDGLHFWRQKRDYTLPFASKPTLCPDNHALNLLLNKTFFPEAYADAD